MRVVGLFILLILPLFANSANAQIHFSGQAKVYDEDNRQIATVYVSANINNGKGTLSIGNRMSATITGSKRNEYYKMTGYFVFLSAPNRKTVNAVITKYDKGGYNMSVNYADGKVLYSLTKPD